MLGLQRANIPVLLASETNGEINFEEFQPMWSQFTNVTDRRTERQTTCYRNTALCTKVHRAVITHCVWKKRNLYTVRITMLNLNKMNNITHRNYQKLTGSLATVVWIIETIMICNTSGPGHYVRRPNPFHRQLSTFLQTLDLSADTNRSSLASETPKHNRTIFLLVNIHPTWIHVSFPFVL